MRILNYILFASLTIVVAGCGQHKTERADSVPKRTIFFDKSGMDTTVKPGNNFFLYANGNWIKNTKIPANETSWGLSFILYNDNQQRLHKILEELSGQNNAKNSKEQKVGDLYKSGMDTVSIDKLGYQPVKPYLNKINAVKDYKGLLQLAGSGFKDGNGFLLGFSVSPDNKNSKINVAHFDQTGLTLPEKGYYFKTDSVSKKIRTEFVSYIQKLFMLTGVDSQLAATKANGILKLETAIAKSHLTPEELRDAQKNYHKLSFTNFQELMPDLDLMGTFKLMGLKTDTIVVGQLSYYRALDTLLKNQPIAVWKDKAAFNILDGAAPSLSKNFVNAHFEFYDKTLNGQNQQKERWKTIVGKVDVGLGELLGQLYVKKYFTPEAKQRMLKLVNNLQNVYRERIKKLDWMMPETKKRAIAKLNAMTKKIGYPDKWKTYNDITIKKDGYYKNLQAIARHDYTVALKKVNKPVDRSEWTMTPPTVNAYYNPAFNEIVFPAGILQFPYFDNNADDAINYGAIGLVIGHEMTHGFDDQGRQYDKDGNLKDWWTREDAEKFKGKMKVMINQYNQYTMLGNLHVNGNLTQGENLADIGGLAIAYQAFKNTQQGKSNVKIDGFTPDQRFFLSCAQVWRSKKRDELVRMSIYVDQHSPGMYRLIGPVSNMPEFYKTFDVKPGEKMYREEKERVKIW